MRYITPSALLARGSSLFLRNRFGALVFNVVLCGPLWMALGAGVTSVAAEGLAQKGKVQPLEAATEVWTPVPPVVEAPENHPPSDAIVLFDGHSLEAWQPVRADGAPWKIEEGAMVIVPSPKPCDQRTKQVFGDVQLHLEWRSPKPSRGEGQDRGNSGVLLMGLYELQILDSYSSSTYVNGQAGAIYKESAPLVNSSRPAGEWQTYDVVFIRPRFDRDGRLKSPARMTVFHNGVLIQHDVSLTGPTPNGPTFHRSNLPEYEAHPDKLPLVLQDHRHPVSFRNIWIREVSLAQ